MTLNRQDSILFFFNYNFHEYPWILSEHTAKILLILTYLSVVVMLQNASLDVVCFFMWPQPYF